MLVALAGRAAEEMFLGERMAGMKGDIEHVRSLLAVMAGQNFFDHFPKPDGTFSDELQKETEEFLKRQLKLVKGLLSENTPLVEVLAKELMEREEILGEAVEKILTNASFGAGL